MSEQAPLILDIDDPLKRGIYRGFNETVRGSLGVFVTKDEVPEKWRMVRRSQSGERPWDDVNMADADVEMAIGEPDRGAREGIMTLANNGDSTGLANLPYNVSAAALQAGMNANPQVTAGASTVVVEQVAPNAFTVAWQQVGVRSLFTGDATNLAPTCTFEITRIKTGTVAIREIQLIRIVRNPYAFTNVFSQTAYGVPIISQAQLGTATKYNVQKLTFDESVEPYDGNLIINFEKPEKTRIPCKANNGVKEKWKITCVADVANSLNMKYFDARNTAGNTTRFYIDTGAGGSAPPVPDNGAGTLISIGVTTNDSAPLVAAAVAAGIDPQGDYVAYVDDNNTVIVELALAGAAEGLYDAPAPDATGFNFLKLVDGNNGPYDGKTFWLYGSLGSCGVTLSVAGEPSDSALEADRQITVTIDTADSANDIATKVKNAIDADADFTAIVVAGTNTVEVTDAVGGERTDAIDIDTGFNINVFQKGGSLTANVEYDAKAADIQKELENYFIVKRRKNGVISFRATTLGSQPAITVDASGLSFPNVLEGRLNLNTFEMILRFGEEPEEESLNLYFQCRITFPGELPYTVIYQVVRVFKTVIDAGTATSVPLPSVTGINYRVKPDGTFQIKNTDTLLWHTLTVTGAAGFATLTIPDPGEA